MAISSCCQAEEAVGGSGQTTVIGYTDSITYPTSVGAQDSSYNGGVDTFVTRLSPPASLTRTIAYTYDGLLRLIGAVETPGNTYAYSYDDTGNRTGVWINGTQVVNQTYDAANQVAGWSYDAAGNLRNNGTQTYAYDALNRLIHATPGLSDFSYSYNGDGKLVAANRKLNGLGSGITTTFSLDLAAPLSQVLRSSDGTTTTDYLYGASRLASLSSSVKTWYLGDALGSVRRTVADSGSVLGAVNYDPWGQLESGSVPTFGFTGE